MAPLLAEGGTFVSASLTEGVSLTLLEAMAVGLPAVVTAVGGNPEVVVDGVTGVLVSSPQRTAAAADVRVVVLNLLEGAGAAVGHTQHRRGQCLPS